MAFAQELARAALDGGPYPEETLRKRVENAILEGQLPTAKTAQELVAALGWAVRHYGGHRPGCSGRDFDCTCGFISAAGASRDLTKAIVLMLLAGRSGIVQPLGLLGELVGQPDSPKADPFQYEGPPWPKDATETVAIEPPPRRPKPDTFKTGG